MRMRAFAPLASSVSVMRGEKGREGENTAGIEGATADDDLDIGVSVSHGDGGRTKKEIDWRSKLATTKQSRLAGHCTGGRCV